MSRRPEAAAAPPSKGKRLDAVLRAGLEQKAAEKVAPSYKEADIGAGFYPSDGWGALSVLALGRAQLNPRTYTPAFHRMPEEWNAVDPAEWPLFYKPRLDKSADGWNEWPNVFNKKEGDYTYTFQKVNGIAELKKLKTPDGEAYFTGDSGWETLEIFIPTGTRDKDIVMQGIIDQLERDYRTNILALKKNITETPNASYIAFAGRDLLLQTVDKFRLTIDELVKLGDAIPPPLDGDDAPLTDAITGSAKEIDHLWLEWKHIRVVLGETDAGLGTTTVTKTSETPLTFSSGGLSYAPGLTRGYISLGDPAVVLRRDEQEYKYDRDSNDILHLRESVSREGEWQAPNRIKLPSHEELKKAEEAEKKKRGERGAGVALSYYAIVLLVQAAMRPARLSDTDQKEFERLVALYDVARNDCKAAFNTWRADAALSMLTPSADDQRRRSGRWNAVQSARKRRTARALAVREFVDSKRASLSMRATTSLLRSINVPTDGERA